MGLVRARQAERDHSRARQEADNARDEARANLQLAREQEQRANTSRDEAQKQKRQADNAAHETRRQTYLANILAADAAIQSNEIVSARKRLEATPSEFRNWEWNYLHAALNESITPVLVEDGARRNIIAISLDATRAVTQIVDGIHTIWNLDTVTPIAHFRREAELLAKRALEFSPDGTRIVAILDDRTVHFWDTATGEQLPGLVLSGYNTNVYMPSFSPDATRMVTSSEYKLNYIWDATTGKKLTVLPGLEQGEDSASFSPDGTRIVTASWDSMAHVWDAATGERLATLDGSDDRVHGSRTYFDHRVLPALFSPDGERIVTASENHTARIFDAATGEPLAVFLHDSLVRSAKFSPDGTRIVTASSDRTARIWDAATGDSLVILRGHTADVNMASFSPDGTRVVTASSDWTVCTWDAATGIQLGVFRGHENSVHSASFTPDGTRIVSASDHAAHVWDAMADDQRRVLDVDTISDSVGYIGVESVSFSPDGARILTSSYNYEEPHRIWDAVTGEQLTVLPPPDGFKWGGSPSFSPDGTRIVDTRIGFALGYANEYYSSVRIWDAVTGEQMGMLSGHDNMGPASFSPDETRIVTAGRWRNKTARIWDAATGEQLGVIHGHESTVTSASFSPDGMRIVTGSLDGTARIWNVASREQLTVLRGHEDRVWSASFSPDGTRVVTVSWDKTARIWDAANGNQLFVLRGHGEMHSGTFSPDGTRIVTASQDNTARVWDVATGEQLVVLRGHEVAMKSASFSPDGTRIVTGHDTTIRIWDGISRAQRYRERRVLREAKQKAARVLDVFLATAPQQNGAPDLHAVAESIRTDSAVDEAVRHMAINLLMHRAGAIQPNANDLLDELKARFVFAADIRKAVLSDSSLEPAARAAAINTARWIDDSPGRLSHWASQIVDDDDRSPADYQQAQRAAALAFESDPISLDFAHTLAAAWNRLHQPDKAVKVWRENVDQVRAAASTEDWVLPYGLLQYGRALLNNDRTQDAEALVRECLSIFENNRDQWRIQESRRALAECLTAQGSDPSLTLTARIEKLREAEALLIELANATLADDTSSEDDKTTAIQRVVDLYEAWHTTEPGKGYDVQATEWRAKLPAASTEETDKVQE